MSSAHEQHDNEEREGQGGATEDSEDRYQEGRGELEKLEKADEVPTDPRDWPGGKAKYLTFGGGEGQSDDAFGDGMMAKLGPGDVHHQPDGSVIVKGEKVENPDDYKGEPIPGGPTDPNAPKLQGERDLSAEKEAASAEKEESSSSEEEDAPSAEETPSANKETATAERDS